MRSTGEVMASASDLPTAFAKAERAAGRRLPASGTAFLSVRDEDKDVVVPVAQALAGLGFRLLATAGTARTLASAGLAVEYVRKVTEEGDGPTVVDLVRRGRCDLVVNTPQGSGARTDGYRIREAALVARVPCITTVSGAAAAVEAIAHARDEVALSLQERIQNGVTHGSPVGPLLRDSGESPRTVAPAGQSPAPPAAVACSQKEEPGAARSA
jgi:carbamoyl-phosphate synthase large subunit